MYDMADLRHEFGEKMTRPDDAYQLDTHQGARSKLAAGTHVEIGRVSDSTDDESGTMILVEAIAFEVPKSVQKQKPEPKAVAPKARPIVPKQPTVAKTPDPSKSKRSLFSPLGGKKGNK